MSIPIESHDCRFYPMKYPMLTHRKVSYFVYPRKDARGVFYYRFSHGSENHHKSTKVYTRKEAILRAVTAIEKVLNQTPVLGLSQAPQGLNLSTIVASYLEGRKTVLAPSTLVSVTHILKRLFEPFGAIDLAQITIPIFHGFLNRLHVQLKPENSYWRDHLTRYNQFFKWCRTTQGMLVDPLQGYPRPKTSSLNVYEEVVEDHEFSLLCAHVNVDDEFALKCFRFMGIYPMDYAFAEKKDFFLNDGVLTLYRKRGKNHLKFNQPLDGRIEPAIKQLWASRRDPRARMFWNGSKEEYRSWYYCLQKRLYRAWHHCGLGKHKKIGAFRHTFFTEAIERGVPEDVLLVWGGYSPGSTILRRFYLHRKSTARYRYVETTPAIGLDSLQLNNK